MVARLSGRGHIRGLSVSSSMQPAPSSAGWRFHLRGDSLSFSRSPDHHIVHSSARDEIDKLNGYLRTEAQINAGASPRSVRASTAHSPAAGHGLLSVGADLDLGFGAWSMSALPGEQAARRRRAGSTHQVKARDIPYFLCPVDDDAGGATMSPPLSRQASAEHYLCDSIADYSTADLLAAQSPPPLHIVGSPHAACHGARQGQGTRPGLCEAEDLAATGQWPRLESLPQAGRGHSMQELASRPLQTMRRGPNTNSIIDLYVGGAADDTAGDVGSARTSSGSRHGSIPPIGAGAGVDSALRPFSAIDTGFLSAVTALLPETPDTSAECSPGDPHGCVGWHGQRPPDGDLRASRELRADEELLAARLAEREQQFALTLALERRRHADEMARQRDAAQAQHGAELEAAHAVCDQLRALLEDCIATSEELVRQSESERDGLARELGSSTLERRRLEEQLGASHSRAAALESEQRAAQTQARAQTAENARLQELCATLLGDVATAEERNTRIKEHAQDTLSKANAEISRLQSQADQTQKAAAELEARVAKAEARARSLHIQLTSTKQQNADLLALCEGL